MIINAIYQTFETDNEFLARFWRSLEFIGAINENASPNTQSFLGKAMDLAPNLNFSAASSPQNSSLNKTGFNNISIDSPSPTKGKISKNKLFKEKFEKSLFKEIVGHFISIPLQEFNQEIRKKIIKIKNLALDWTNEIFNKFVEREMSREFMEGKVTLYKIYLLNTTNENIMNRVRKNLEIIKYNFSAMIKNMSYFENQLATSTYYFGNF